MLLIALLAWVSGGLFGVGIQGLLSTWRNRRKLQRLRGAALAVLTDWRERAESYPGWFRQPHLLKVMNNLVDAIEESL